MLLNPRQIIVSGVLLAMATGSAACGGGGSSSTQTTGSEATTAVTSTSTGASPTTDAPTSDAPITGSDGTTGTASTSSSTGGTVTGTTTGAAPETTSGSTSTGSSSSTGDMEVDVPVLPSPGCGLGGAPTGHLDEQKTTVDGVERFYDMFVPTPYDAAKPHALIFSYHGVDGTANTNQFQLDTLSTENAGFSINVAPQGWTAPEWNQKHFVPFNLDASLVVFEQVLDKLAGDYCIDLNRVFVIGMSNGGQMAFHLGCLRSDRVRAVFPFGGRCFSYGPGVCDPYNDVANQCDGAVMVMSVMGEDDVTRHADEEATLAGFAARQGCSGAQEPVAPAPCLGFTGCDAGAEVATCRIPGLAHQIWKDGLADIYAVMMSL